ncbi:uncharacterized protein LOC143030253 [Oratosquilla oratoria]|uniref:uncharacterized protein LOC143030253 n=1 Tax=Oratosquilla oratoria TaxID=337810 RepID=UPI003F761F79
MVEPGTLGGQPWQMVLNGNMECLKYLYTSGEYSDLDIIFPEGVCIKAHRLILSMKSPVFGAMLMGPMATTGKQLNLPEDPHEVFRKLLEHTYLDRMDLESVEEALEVYALAHKYLMETARKFCLQYILSNLREETTLAALETSVVHGDKELKDKCIEMLSRDPDAVMSSETVSHLSKEALRVLLKSDDIGFSSEAVPFKGLIAWGRAQLSPEEEEPSGSAVRRKIGDDLLKEVRFLDMSCDEFIENVVGTDVLTRTECFHIQRAIDGADLSTLPEDTPLNPTRGGRAPRLRKREELSCWKLDLSASYKEYTSSSEVVLFEGLSSDVTIQLHHMSIYSIVVLLGRRGGELNIMDGEGKTISTATSEYGNITFARPAVLWKDKKYRVVFYPRRDVMLIRGRSGGRATVGNATLSFSRVIYVSSISGSRQVVRREARHCVPSVLWKRSPFGFGCREGKERTRASFMSQERAGPVPNGDVEQIRMVWRQQEGNVKGAAARAKCVKGATVDRDKGRGCSVVFGSRAELLTTVAIWDTIRAYDTMEDLYFITKCPVNQGDCSRSQIAYEVSYEEQYVPGQSLQSYWAKDARVTGKLILFAIMPNVFSAVRCVRDNCLDHTYAASPPAPEVRKESCNGNAHGAPTTTLLTPSGTLPPIHSLPPPPSLSPVSSPSPTPSA